MIEPSVAPDHASERRAVRAAGLSGGAAAA
jgi:hypothetical protein